jgi:hypothetical protein
MPNPTPASVTPTRRLCDALLGRSLDEYVAERRDQGRSWRRICMDLLNDIGVDVHFATLRSWYPDSPQVAADDEDRAAS